MITVDQVLDRIAEKMDISREMAEQATTAYESVGRYLQNDLAGDYVIDIHPQGSFNLGTVVRPNFDSDEYDIDLVCLVNNLNGKKIGISPSKLKLDIGNSLMGSERYKAMLAKEGKQ